eukprot:c20828_g1_i2.p1 GENE.c20828_g1_i2~~c20828_g1_i2.p1  ORF type:complete len:707 (-),score=235.75 c20828_g1_i2:6-2126(-)
MEVGSDDENWKFSLEAHWLSKDHQHTPFWNSEEKIKIPQLTISCKGENFVDEFGRVVTLRGVNLGGNCKIPKHPKSDTHLKHSLSETKNVSFVDRPFPLNQADEHFSRLRSYGFNCLRFLVTWEAIEHDGPGIYDQEYLNYIRQILLKAASYGFAIFIDPHQDVWSRFSGGDGAPAWTFDLIGLDVHKFTETGAAILHSEHHNGGTNFPLMIWPTNAFKFACSTMFTLFYGGNHFASNCKVNDINIQDYLQSHYINAMTTLMEKVSDIPSIIGIGVMNEPLPGFIGWPRLDDLWKGSNLKRGAMPTPFESMKLSSGFTCNIKTYSKIGTRNLSVEINKKKVSAWKEGYSCVWKSQGIWDIDQKTGNPILKNPLYFANADFGKDFYLPFVKKFQESIRRVFPKAVMFIELPPDQLNIADFPMIDRNEFPNCVNASHWYDGFTLFIGRFQRRLNFDVGKGKLVLGSKQVDEMMSSQLKEIKDFGSERMEGSPTLIGECGIPFTLNDNIGYKGIYKMSRGVRVSISSRAKMWAASSHHQQIFSVFDRHIRAMNTTIKALESNNLSYTLWNYCATHTSKYGDGWNLEDLSIYSPQLFIDKTDSYSGGRALPAIIRPFSVRVSGIPVSSRFRISTGVFQLVFESTAEIGNQNPTEIFLPFLHYPNGYEILVSDGTFRESEWDNQNKSVLVLYTHSQEVTKHTLTIQRKDPL